MEASASSLAICLEEAGAAREIPAPKEQEKMGFRTLEIREEAHRSFPVEKWEISTREAEKTKEGLCRME